MKNGKYILVIAPKNYSGMKYRERYCYEHHLVWWENTGEIISDGEVIHHINDDKYDNRFENLQKMSVEEHNKLHATGKMMCELLCPVCKRKFTREKRKTFLVQPSEVTFCSRRCIGKFNYRKVSREKVEEAKRINLIRTFVG